MPRLVRGRAAAVGGHGKSVRVDAVVDIVPAELVNLHHTGAFKTDFPIFSIFANSRLIRIKHFKFISRSVNRMNDAFIRKEGFKLPP